MDGGSRTARRALGALAALAAARAASIVNNGAKNQVKVTFTNYLTGTHSMSAAELELYLSASFETTLPAVRRRQNQPKRCSRRSVDAGRRDVVASARRLGATARRFFVAGPPSGRGRGPAAGRYVDIPGAGRRRERSRSAPPAGGAGDRGLRDAAAGTGTAKK